MKDPTNKMAARTLSSTLAWSVSRQCTTNPLHQIQNLATFSSGSSSTRRKIGAVQFSGIPWNGQHVNPTFNTRKFSTTTSFADMRVAIVGSGPSGFYTAKFLLRTGVGKISMFDRFPTPFGLVRYGVAPDHPEVKNVINDFEEVVEKNPGKFDYFGNVEVGDVSSSESQMHSLIGATIPLSDLKQEFDAVVLCTGARWGKSLLNHEKAIDAYSFVKWYNGYPDGKAINLENVRNVSVVGLGNVALDVARMFVISGSDRVATSDIMEYARKSIVDADVNRVDVIGRRGAIQNQFGNKELRELLKAEECIAILDPKELEISLNDASKAEIKAIRMKKRQLEQLEQMASNYKPEYDTLSGAEQDTSKKIVQLRVLWSPTEHLGNALSMRRMSLHGEANAQTAKPAEPDEMKQLPSDLVLESIGFGFPLIDSSLKGHVQNPDSLDVGPFENTRGHIVDNVFCGGWVRRGPRGTIASNVGDAQETCKSVLTFLQKEQAKNTTEITPLADRTRVTNFADWLKLKEIELTRGSEQKKAAVKFDSIKGMLDALD